MIIRIEHKPRDKPKREGRKKTEFSKLLAVWAVCIITAAVATSYALAALDKQTASDIPNALIYGCFGYLVTYAGKSLAEKHSRNKYGIGEDGFPVPPRNPAASPAGQEIDMEGGQ